MSNHFTGLSLGPPLGDQRLDRLPLVLPQPRAVPRECAQHLLRLRAHRRPVHRLRHAPIFTHGTDTHGAPEPDHAPGFSSDAAATQQRLVVPAVLIEAVLPREETPQPVRSCAPRCAACQVT